MTIDITVNPLNLVGGRCLTHLPPFLQPCFTVTNKRFSFSYKQLEIQRWIEANLKGRYWIGEYKTLEDNTIRINHGVAFEIPSEGTIFLLKCPFLSEITSSV